MTFKDAAVKILNEKNVPMSASEIWEEISKQDLIQSNGKTPEASLSTVLLVYSNNSNISKKRNSEIFTIVDENPHKFILIKNDKVDIIEDVNKSKNTNSKELIYECVLDDGDILMVYNDNSTLSYDKVKCVVGYTYFILDETRQIIKIGRESIMGDRLKAFKTSNPDLKLKYIIPGDYNEKILHKKFDSLHYDREWFFYGKGIKDFIKNEKIKSENAKKCYDLFLDSKKYEKEFLRFF